MNSTNAQGNRFQQRVEDTIIRQRRERHEALVAQYGNPWPQGYQAQCAKERQIAQEVKEQQEKDAMLAKAVIEAEAAHQEVK